MRALETGKCLKTRQFPYGVFAGLAHSCTGCGLDHSVGAYASLTGGNVERQKGELLFGCVDPRNTLLRHESTAVEVGDVFPCL